MIARHRVDVPLGKSGPQCLLVGSRSQRRQADELGRLAAQGVLPVVQEQVRRPGLTERARSMQAGRAQCVKSGRARQVDEVDLGTDLAGIRGDAMDRKRLSSGRVAGLEVLRCLLRSRGSLAGT